MTSKYIYLHHNRTHTKIDLQHALTGIEARYDICTYFNTIVHRGQQTMNDPISSSENESTQYIASLA